MDILTDRLRVASHEQDVLRAYEKLCASLHISNTKAESGWLETLFDENEKVMEILQEHTAYIAILSQKKARESRLKNKGENKNENRKD